MVGRCWIILTLTNVEARRLSEAIHNELQCFRAGVERLGQTLQTAAHNCALNLLLELSATQLIRTTTNLRQKPGERPKKKNTSE